MNKRQKFPNLVGSKWTATQKTWGWRHFQVINRSQQGEWIFVEMVASCDRKVRFWLNAEQLFEGSSWRASWLSLAQMSEESDCSFE